MEARRARAQRGMRPSNAAWSNCFEHRRSERVSRTISCSGQVTFTRRIIDSPESSFVHRDPQADEHTVHHAVPGVTLPTVRRVWPCAAAGTADDMDIDTSTPLIREPSGRPLVLVTNDDGIESPGIHALARALVRAGAQVVVAAPAENMSGAAAAIGPVQPQVPARRVTIDGFDGPAFAVQAPPAMIVIAALGGAFGGIPTAVASGVNDGVNLGRAILHSGTVGAALTGQNLGLPSIAVSLEPGGDVEVAATVGADVFTRLLATGEITLANINVPTNGDLDSPRVTTELASFGAATAAITGDALDFQLTIDPQAMDEPGTDGAAVRAGHISITWLNGFAGSVRSEPSFFMQAISTETADR